MVSRSSRQERFSAGFFADLYFQRTLAAGTFRSEDEVWDEVTIRFVRVCTGISDDSCGADVIILAMVDVSVNPELRLVLLNKVVQV